MLTLIDWKKNPVPVYLMACYAYEVLSYPIMTDAQFDELGKYLADNEASITHRHKQYIDFACCAYTSGVAVPYDRLPLIVLSATHHALGEPTKNSGGVYERCLEYWGKYYSENNANKG